MALITKLEDNDDDYINLRIKKSDAGKYLLYSLFIEKHSKLGNKIPQRVFDTFFSLFNYPEEELEKYYRKKTEEIIEKTVEHFDSDRDYVFEGFIENKHEPDEDVPIEYEFFGFNAETLKLPTYSFKQMVNEVCWKITRHEENLHNKNDVLVFGYDFIDQYLKKWLSENEYNDFSLYSKIVISGFITLQYIGKLSKNVDSESVKLFSTKKSINESVYYASRYSIEKHTEREQIKNRTEDIHQKTRRKK